MENLFKALIIIVGILQIVLISLQSRDGGLSSTFGGSGGGYGTRRGIEKSIFMMTWINSVLFMFILYIYFFQIS